MNSGVFAVVYLCAVLLSLSPVIPQGAAAPAVEQQFQEAERLFQRYLEYPIQQGTQKQLERTIKEKLQRMRSAYRAFEEILEDEPPTDWTVGALVRMAEILLHLVEVIESIPPREAMSSEEWDVYQPSRRETAFSFEMKAIALLEAALKLVHRLDLYCHWADRAVVLLRELEVDEFDPLRPLPVTTDHMSLNPLINREW